ncbi:FAD:protein FMN transferase [Polaribacter gochangensis]|uniref:FAD:protein FMN transferase n=1 Tax=Polaribacter gochangensis TaxID=3252903 RepID=UPI003904DCE8
MKKSFLLLFAVFLFSCASEKETQTINFEGFVFGTTYHITILHQDNVNYQKAIDSLFFLVNKSLSTYITTSDVSKINSGDSTVIVDALFAEVFQKSKRIFKETDGYFDPTVGNLVNAWGFGPNKSKKEIDSLSIHKMMRFVGLDKVQLKKNKIEKQFQETYLDFNSIAKGFGIDVVGRFLESKKVHDYLVEIGGEIRARGKNKKGNFWNVAIEKPNTDGTQSFQTTVQLENSSMATSGNYRKYRISNEGKKYVHTVNPKTGFAKESNLLSASVISNLDCADVDAYATAFMAMGFEKTKAFLKSHNNVKVILIYLNEDNSIEEYRNF